MADSVPTLEKQVMVIDGISIKTETAHGAAAVRKLLHPPTTIPTEFVGYPDNSSANAVQMEVKGVENIQPVIVTPLTATTTLTENSSKVMLLSPNGGKVASYVFIWSNSKNGWVQPISYPVGSLNPAISNPAPGSVNNAGYNWLNFLQDVATMRTIYKSQTCYLNATDFSNQGEVATASFKPSILYANSYNGLAKQHADCPKSLKSLRDCLKLQAKHQDDDYELLDTKSPYPTEYAIQVLEVDRPDSVISVIPNSASTQYFFRNVLCDTPSEVMSLSSKSAMRPAKEGSFAVHCMTGPTMDWTTPGAGSASVASTPDFSGPIISVVRARNGNTFTYFPLYSVRNIPTLAATTSAYLGDAPWNNLDWKITIFDGLTVPPTTGVAVSGAPYITVKSFCGLELQPQFGSSLRPFQRLRPPPDETAIKMISTVFHVRPDDLPASANDLASIASTAIKLLPTAVTWLKDLFGGMKQKQSAVAKAQKFVEGKPKSSKKPVSQNNRAITDLTRKVNTLLITRSPALPTIKPQIPTPAGGTRRSRAPLPQRANKPRATKYVRRV